jgi:zinc transport system substrate-binding protein
MVGDKRRPAIVSFLLVSLGLILVVSGACTRSRRGRPRVAASIFPLYDVTRRVAGDLPVRLVLPPGRSEVGFEPDPRTVDDLKDAELIFAVGLGLDPWLQALVKGAGTAKVFELAPLLDPILIPPGIAAPEGRRGAESVDPHFWMDPVRMGQAVELIVVALERLDPVEAPRIRARGNEVKRSLALLHEEIARRASSWTQRRIATVGRSFLYFAERYHLEIVAVVAPPPAGETTAPDLAKVREAIRKGGAVALFSEPLFDRGAKERIVSGAAVPFYELDPLGGGEGLDSYEKLLRHDVDVLERALQ